MGTTSPRPWVFPCVILFVVAFHDFRSSSFCNVGFSLLFFKLKGWQSHYLQRNGHNDSTFRSRSISATFGYILPCSYRWNPLRIKCFDSIQIGVRSFFGVVHIQYPFFLFSYYRYFFPLFLFVIYSRQRAQNKKRLQVDMSQTLFNPVVLSGSVLERPNS
jgi:hypothetical protein